jgi:hypothetical protein
VTAVTFVRSLVRLLLVTVLIGALLIAVAAGLVLAGAWSLLRLLDVIASPSRA